jgi:hypothetical protein
MRINRFWQFWRWLPVFLAMPRMVNELRRDPSLGLLGRPGYFTSGRVFLLIQYWRSFDDLERYAREPEGRHLNAWRAFNRRVRDNGSVGIFHETYRVPTHAVETFYGNMRCSAWLPQPHTRRYEPACTAPRPASRFGLTVMRRSSLTELEPEPRHLALSDSPRAGDPVAARGP